jgi:hypothetical protein
MKRAPAKLLTTACAAMLLLCAMAWRSFADAPAGRYAYPMSGIVHDTRTALLWQQTPATNMGQAAASSYCIGLAGGGWRLPTVHELMTLTDDTISTLDSVAKLDATAFPVSAGNSRMALYWSSTLVSGETGMAWGVNYWALSSLTAAGVNASTPRTRCVRLVDSQ